MIDRNCPFVNVNVRWNNKTSYHKRIVIIDGPGGLGFVVKCDDDGVVEVSPTLVTGNVFAFTELDREYENGTSRFPN